MSRLLSMLVLIEVSFYLDLCLRLPGTCLFPNFCWKKVAFELVCDSKYPIPDNVVDAVRCNLPLF